MALNLDRLTPRLRPYSASIFGEMSALAREHNAVNLGQGFPDTDGPEALKQIAISAIQDGSGNQYPPVHGQPALREAVAEHQERFYRLVVDPATDVVVTTGASEALAAALIALLRDGDEVIVLEPYFDLYGAAISMAGGRRITVPLLQPEPGSGDGFRLDADALRAAITGRTRVILLNSPHNPTGMVLTAQELAAVSAVARAHDLLVISDEAYEHIVFEPSRHVPISTLPGMFERTVTIGSGGKSFSFTGWKIGWASGPTDLITAVRVARQHLSFVSGGPFQLAIAAGLRLPSDYFEDFRTSLASRRDHLSRGLSALGFEVLPTDGTYFVTTDIRSLRTAKLGTGSGGQFCANLPQRAGVAAIPISALCDDPSQYAPYVRWSFCKQPGVLDEALRRLSNALA